MSATPPITIDGLKKHARRYGCDGVIETAVSGYHRGELTLENVIEVQTDLDSLEKRSPWAGKRKLSVETRVKRLLGIESEEPEAA